jgi:hypothetical protein
MDSEQQIADYIQQTAQNTPGFQQHSNHTRDIAQRSREVAQWAIRYYWPLGAAPSRDTGYNTPPTPIASFSYHQAKREAAQERIKAAIAQIQEEGTLPKSASERAELLIKQVNISKKTLYLKVNRPLWHPDHIASQERPKLNPEAETHNQQDSLQPSSKTENPGQPQPLEPLSNKVCLLLFKYVGFVILNLLSEAVAALPPQGQRAARTAIALPEPQKIQEGGSPRRESTPTKLPITNFAELKTILPDSFQAKIAKAERQRKQDQDREQQRRERALARQQQLTLSPHPTPQLDPHSVHNPVSPKRLTAPCPVPRALIAPLERLPSAAEQQEFESWYALAAQFKLVNDHRWEDCEYWVYCNGEWETYCELSGTFTTRRLRQYLHLEP